jgi:hypothetical protein
MKDIRGMLSRKYGIDTGKLDRNGYGKSIMMAETDHCYFCGDANIARHEVVYGTANRGKSKALGLWITVCPHHHTLLHNPAEEADIRRSEKLKQDAQRRLDELHGEGTFFRIYGQNA